jgi:inositol-phosphate phosphatase/L-galactose 1-phosphate phosphatase/histidinol-phosphatase
MARSGAGIWPFNLAAWRRCGGRGGTAAAAAGPRGPRRGPGALSAAPTPPINRHDPWASPSGRRAAAAPPAAAAAAAAPAAGACGDPAAATPELLALAHALADAAAAVTTRYFRARSLPVDAKSDASPVTAADREAEAAMRALLAERAPAHAVFGEEAGFSGSADAEYMWVLDPIDGTKSFITGKPVFGTLVALLHRGAPVLGLLDQPVTRERWAGAAGAATTLNGAPVAVRPCADLADAYLYATTPHMFAGATEVSFNRVRDAVRIPLYGCDCYAYGLLAAGHVDLVVEADLKPYDYLALAPIVAGAGGCITGRARRCGGARPRRRRGARRRARSSPRATRARTRPRSRCWTGGGDRREHYCASIGRDAVSECSSSFSRCTFQAASVSEGPRAAHGPQL